MPDQKSLIKKIGSLSQQDVKEVEDFVEFKLFKKKAAKRSQKESQPGFLFGAAKNFFIVREDFNEPLDDFKDYM